VEGFIPTSRTLSPSLSPSPLVLQPLTEIHDIWTTMPALDEVFPEGHHFGKYWGSESQVK
jgi:hypothetical protein